MQLYELLNELLELLIPCLEKERKISSYAYMYDDKTKKTFKVKKYNQYILILEKIYLNNDTLKKRFSKKTIYDFINKNITIHKSQNLIYDSKDNNLFFKKILEIKPQTIQIVTPISGVYFQNVITSLNLGNFEIAYGKEFNLVVSNPDTLHIKTKIYNIYDVGLAFEEASLYLRDFIKLVALIYGNFTSPLYIKTGYPLYEDKDKIGISVDFPGASLYLDNGDFIGSNNNSKLFRKLAIDNPDLINHPKNLHILWTLYQSKNENKKLSDINKRIINASLAIGESVQSHDSKNALIYTCIALESLFSFDTKQLFQDSISDKISNFLAFIVGKDKAQRKEIIKFSKQVYSARSALVHGSQSSHAPDFVYINYVLREAIIELLYNDKYKDLKTINQLYDMVKDAQISY